MPDTVPYLDANGKKQSVKTYDYIKAELQKELTVRDSISEALADTSSEGIIPQFKAAVKKSQEEKSYSLPKGGSAYWYPKMTKTEIAEVKDIPKNEAKKTDSYLGIDTKWLYNNQKGHRYFALYSTAREEITLLYACKDDSAEFEYNLLMAEIKKGGYLYGSSDPQSGSINGLLSRIRNVSDTTTANPNGTVGAGSNSGNASTHSGNRRKRPNAAFESCIKNIEEVQSRYGLDDHYLFAVERGDLQHCSANGG